MSEKTQLWPRADSVQPILCATEVQTILRAIDSTKYVEFSVPCECTAETIVVSDYVVRNHPQHSALNTVQTKGAVALSTTLRRDPDCTRHPSQPVPTAAQQAATVPKAILACGTTRPHSAAWRRTESTEPAGQQMEASGSDVGHCDRCQAVRLPALLHPSTASDTD